MVKIDWLTMVGMPLIGVAIRIVSNLLLPLWDDKVWCCHGSTSARARCSSFPRLESMLPLFASPTTVLCRSCTAREGSPKVGLSFLKCATRMVILSGARVEESQVNWPWLAFQSNAAKAMSVVSLSCIESTHWQESASRPFNGKMMVSLPLPQAVQTADEARYLHISTLMYLCFRNQS